MENFGYASELSFWLHGLLAMGLALAWGWGLSELLLWMFDITPKGDKP